MGRFSEGSKGEVRGGLFTKIKDIASPAVSAFIEVFIRFGASFSGNPSVIEGNEMTLSNGDKVKLVKTDETPTRFTHEVFKNYIKGEQLPDNFIEYTKDIQFEYGNEGIMSIENNPSRDENGNIKLESTIKSSALETSKIEEVATSSEAMANILKDAGFEINDLTATAFSLCLEVVHKYHIESSLNSGYSYASLKEVQTVDKAALKELLLSIKYPEKDTN